jgi:hypothetical protein
VAKDGTVTVEKTPLNPTDAANKQYVDGKFPTRVLTISSAAADASLTTDRNLMLGSKTGTNLVMDGNEIQARSNGIASPLSLQENGGDLIFGGIKAGNVGIGTTTTGAKLDVKGNGQAVAIISVNGTYKSDWVAGWVGGLATWDIVASGIYASEFRTRSDARLKEGVQPIPGVEASAKIMELRPVSFRWKETEKKGDDLHLGFIAQEVEKLFPKWWQVRVTKQKGPTIAVSSPF